MLALNNVSTWAESPHEDESNLHSSFRSHAALPWQGCFLLVGYRINQTNHTIEMGHRICTFLTEMNQLVASQTRHAWWPPFLWAENIRSPWVAPTPDCERPVSLAKRSWFGLTCVILEYAHVQLWHWNNNPWAWKTTRCRVQLSGYSFVAAVIVRCGCQFGSRGQHDDSDTSLWPRLTSFITRWQLHLDTSTTFISPDFLRSTDNNPFESSVLRL